MAQVNYEAENPFDESDNFVNESKQSGRPSLPQKQATSRSSTNVSSNDPALLAKVEELRKKEEELNRREDMLDKRGQVLVDRENGLASPRAPNWPRCRPLIYMNIEGDMTTPELLRLMKLSYYGWIACFALVIWNVGMMLGVVIAEQGTGQAIADLILSIVYCIFFPIMWFGIFRVLYRAARKSKPSLYIVWFILFFPFSWACWILFAIGIPGFGMGGFFYMIQEFKNKHTTMGVFLVIAAVLWCGLVLFQFYLFFVARREYKKAGGTEKAKGEASSAAINEAKKHPDLVKKGANAAGKEALKHPDLVKAAVNSQV